MKRSKHDLDAIIDNVSEDIRSEVIENAMINEAATRVWAKVSQQASAPRVTSMQDSNTTRPNLEIGQIAGCEDFQSLIPAYLGGELSSARKLLLEDHTNECVVCRREVKEQKAMAAAKSATYVSPRHTARGSGSKTASKWTPRRVARWAVPAGLAVVVAIAGLFAYERLDVSGTTLAATVESTDGEVFLASDIQFHQLAAGEQLLKGQRIRTAKGSTAVLKLSDGSTIEMRERSEFYVTENMRGVTIKLDRGDVIVEAAKQHNGRLYVQTPDSLVSVKGTIFAVESGTKGSRVSVVEGEVEVSHAGKNETLHPGDQTTTKPELDKTSVEQNVAWSRNASKYTNLVSELAKLRRDVDKRAVRPGVRTSSRFLDLVPENTVFFAALPNLTATLGESQRVMQERIKQNPALAEWWKGEKDHGMDQRFFTRIQEFGSQLGEEIVVSAEMDSKGEPSSILVLGELKNPAGFRSYLDEQVARVAKESGEMPNIQIVEDPLTAKAAPARTSDKQPRTDLYVWINKDVFAASPSVEALKRLANNANTPSKFVGSAFYQRISDVYKEGAGLVVAADLEKIVSQAVAKDTSEGAERRREGLEQLGVMNLRHFVVEQKESQGKTLTKADLSFSETSHGVASWLAAPGSMGALDYISNEANVVTAFVVKDPALLVDDLLRVFDSVAPELRGHMQEVEKQQGIDVRNDFAAPLGGEFAFAIDGPILPTPSWKMIVEVYDVAKLQQSFERVVEKLNQFSAIHGKGKVNIESSQSGGNTFYSIKSTEPGLEVYYTYSNGYLVVAPSRALLDKSLSLRDSGSTLLRSGRFSSALPQDGNTNFSAIFYHDLAPLIGPLAQKLKTVGGNDAVKDSPLSAIDANAPPTLAYAYANGDRITIAANTEGGPFGLSPANLIGIPNSFEMQHILMNAMEQKDVKQKE